jgi:hypothetical protein
MGLGGVKGVGDGQGVVQGEYGGVGGFLVVSARFGYLIGLMTLGWVDDGMNFNVVAS